MTATASFEMPEPSFVSPASSVSHANLASPFQFSSHTVVVTGGGGGIGLATVLEFLARGARVVAVDISSERCEALRACRSDDALTVLQADLSTADGLDGLAIQLVDLQVETSILVNVAGTVAVKPFLLCERGDWLEVLQVNLLSMAMMARLVLPGMCARKSGTIVNMASLSAHLATPLESMYCVSKAAVVQLTRALAVEFRGSGIRCNSVSPSMVDTRHGRSEIAALQREGVALSMDDVVAGQLRLAQPSEIARAILFLASEEASFINGVDVVIDNGWSAGAGA